MFFSSSHSVDIFEINYRLCFNQNYDSKLPVSCNAVLCVAGWGEGGLESFTLGGSKYQILLFSCLLYLSTHDQTREAVGELLG